MLLRADIFKSFGLTSSLCVSFMMLPYGNLKVTQHLLHESHILSTHVSYIKSLLRLHLHFSTTVSPVCSNLFYIWITEFVFPLVETMWWQRRGGGGGSFFFFFAGCKGVWRHCFYITLLPLLYQRSRREGEELICGPFMPQWSQVI